MIDSRISFALSVEVIEVQGLKYYPNTSDTVTSLPSPYVSIECHFQEKKSPSQPNTTNAIFNYLTIFPNLSFSPSLLSFPVLQITVKHDSLLSLLQSSDTTIGTTTISLSTLYQQPNHAILNHWLPLFHPKHPNRQVVGLLCLSCFLLSTHDIPLHSSLSFSEGIFDSDTSLDLNERLLTLPPKVFPQIYTCEVHLSTLKNAHRLLSLVESLKSLQLVLFLQGGCVQVEARRDGMNFYFDKVVRFPFYHPSFDDYLRGIFFVLDEKGVQRTAVGCFTVHISDFIDSSRSDFITPVYFSPVNLQPLQTTPADLLAVATNFIRTIREGENLPLDNFYNQALYNSIDFYQNEFTGYLLSGFTCVVEKCNAITIMEKSNAESGVEPLQYILWIDFYKIFHLEDFAPHNIFVQIKIAHESFKSNYPLYNQNESLYTFDGENGRLAPITLYLYEESLEGMKIEIGICIENKKVPIFLNKISLQSILLPPGINDVSSRTNPQSFILHQKENLDLTIQVSLSLSLLLSSDNNTRHRPPRATLTPKENYLLTATVFQATGLQFISPEVEKGDGALLSPLSRFASQEKEEHPFSPDWVGEKGEIRLPETFVRISIENYEIDTTVSPPSISPFWNETRSLLLPLSPTLSSHPHLHLQLCSSGSSEAVILGEAYFPLSLLPSLSSLSSLSQIKPQWISLAPPLVSPQQHGDAFQTSPPLLSFHVNHGSQHLQKGIKILLHIYLSPLSYLSQEDKSLVSKKLSSPSSLLEYDASPPTRPAKIILGLIGIRSWLQNLTSLQYISLSCSLISPCDSSPSITIVDPNDSKRRSRVIYEGEASQLNMNLFRVMEIECRLPKDCIFQSFLHLFVREKPMGGGRRGEEREEEEGEEGEERNGEKLIGVVTLPITPNIPWFCGEEREDCMKLFGWGEWEKRGEERCVSSAFVDFSLTSLSPPLLPPSKDRSPSTTLSPLFPSPLLSLLSPPSICVNPNTKNHLLAMQPKDNDNNSQWTNSHVAPSISNVSSQWTLWTEAREENQIDQKDAMNKGIIFPSNDYDLLNIRSMEGFTHIGRALGPTLTVEDHIVGEITSLLSPASPTSPISPISPTSPLLLEIPHGDRGSYMTRPSKNASLEYFLSSKEKDYLSYPLYGHSSLPYGVIKAVMNVLGGKGEQPQRYNDIPRVFSLFKAAESLSIVCRSYILQLSGLVDRRGGTGEIDISPSLSSLSLTPSLSLLSLPFNRTQSFNICLESCLSLPRNAYAIINIRERNKALIAFTIIDIEDRWMSKEWRLQMTNNQVPIEVRDTFSPVSSPLLPPPSSLSSPLLPSLSLSGSFGPRIRMWTDLMSLEKSRLEPIHPLPSEAPIDLEIRVVIWSCKDIEHCKNNGTTSNLFLSGELLSSLSQKGDTSPTPIKYPAIQYTDTHYGSSDGTAEYNWRFLFLFRYPDLHCILRLRLYDGLSTATSVLLGEMSLALLSDVKKVIHTGETIRMKSEIPLFSMEEKKSVVSQSVVEVHLMKKSVADGEKVGLGREYPNRDPFLPEVTHHRNFFKDSAIAKAVVEVAQAIVRGAMMGFYITIVLAVIGGIIFLVIMFK